MADSNKNPGTSVKEENKTTDGGENKNCDDQSSQQYTQVKDAHATGSGTLERSDLEQPGSPKPATDKDLQGAGQY